MLMTPNAFFRFRARKALKNSWQITLMVVFIASLPSILTQVIGVLTGGDISARLMELAQDPAFLMASADSMMKQLTEALIGNGGKTYLLFSALALLIAPALTMGMHHYMIDLLRGQADGVASVFDRLRWFLKAIGLNLLVAMKAFLWAVPGMAVVIGGSAAAVTMADDVAAALRTMFTIMSAGYILMMVLMIAAMLRYAMAMFVLADQPETGLLACIRRSKEIMKGRKTQLFALEFSFVLWHLLVMMAYVAVASMFGYVIGLTVQMFLNLFVASYQNCSVAAFFLQYHEGGELQLVQPEETESLTEDRDDADPWHRNQN